MTDTRTPHFATPFQIRRRPDPAREPDAAEDAATPTPPEAPRPAADGTQAPLEPGAEDPGGNATPEAPASPDPPNGAPDNDSSLLLDQFKTENGSVVLDARQVAELEAFVQQVEELRADHQRLQEESERSAAEKPAGVPDDAPAAVDTRHLRRTVAELRACAWWQTARREWLLEKLAGLVGDDEGS